MARTRSADLTLRLSPWWSLTRRILAVNIFALAMLAGSLFYLDIFRAGLFEQRQQQSAEEVELMAAALGDAPPATRIMLLRHLGVVENTRLRVYGAGGQRFGDSWTGTRPTYVLRDPRQEPWEKDAARFLDRALDAILGARRPPPFIEPGEDVGSAWPEVRQAALSRHTVTALRYAPDRTPMLSAATPIGHTGAVLFMTDNARDITRSVRAERLRLGILIAIVVLVSVLLSLFLARTIVLPLRRLARAAHRVRLGRAREVVVPRLPARRDEIGLLARALSDMSQALRLRIDATEAFAADVAHEIKNPLASLRSAVESLGMVSDPALQERLRAVLRDDIARLDRLITDISEASRLDAELSRTRFDLVDLGLILEALVDAREQRGLNGQVRLAFARPHVGTAMILGDESRLVRAFENLIDNAISFSPPGGLVEVAATRDGDEVVVRVDDEGPGVPAEDRQAVFRRFHSDRPNDESFGRHSGLGLAIAKAIVEGHNGTIEVRDREDGQAGARFLIRFPMANL